MDENNNDAKRSRTMSRSPTVRTAGGDESSDRSRSEHSVELTLPPKKSSKHYNRRMAKGTATNVASPPNHSTASTNSNNGQLVRVGGGGVATLDSTSDKENFCDREKLSGEAITGDGPYQQMRLPDGQMVLMLQPHYMQLAAALGINAHDGMNQMMDFESLIELSRKHQHMVSTRGWI